MSVRWKPVNTILARPGRRGGGAAVDAAPRWIVRDVRSARNR